MTWQPIKTAPKDGTIVLAVDTFPDGSGDVVTIYWETEGDPLIGEEPCWIVREIGTGDFTYGSNLTHWMPLPEPPK